MPQRATFQRLAWDDRFNCPTVASLRAGLKPADRSLFDKLRKHLCEFERVTETVTWYGDSWRWVVEFRVARPAQPFAVIVPSPDELQLAVPTSQEFIAQLATRRLKRAVRDGLDLAGAPFDTRWAVWPVGSASMLADLMHVLDDKRSFMVRTAG
jgi:hypothetical protein